MASPCVDYLRHTVFPRRSVLVVFLVLPFAQKTVAQDSSQDENGVLVLNRENFERTRKASSTLLVNFYAPWCGHCKEFAPTYASVAKKLNGSESAVTCGKVDATREQEVAQQSEIHSFPTLKIYADGRSQEYIGERDEESVVKWALAWSPPRSKFLGDVEDATELEAEGHKAFIVAVFPEPPKWSEGIGEMFKQTCAVSKDATFAHSYHPEVARRYHLSPPAIGAVFPGKTEYGQSGINYGGDLTSTRGAVELQEWVRLANMPSVFKFSGEILPRLVADERATLVLFRDHDAKGMAAQQALKQSTRFLARRFLAIVVEPKDPAGMMLHDATALKEGDPLPSLRFLKHGHGRIWGTAYKLEGDITTESIETFVNQYLAGSLTAVLTYDFQAAAQGAVAHGRGHEM